MAVKWIPLDPKKISSENLLMFRNRTIGLNEQPSSLEVNMLERQIGDCTKDDSMYNLVALDGVQIVAWINGKYSEPRLTDMIRMIFFDSSELNEDGVRDLLRQLELSLPHPFKRIEIYGLGAGREKDIELIMKSGYRKSFEIAHYQWVNESKDIAFDINPNISFDNKIDTNFAFEIYKDAFKNTWDRDNIDIAELENALNMSDSRLCFTALTGEKQIGIMIVNKGLDEHDAYLQIIAIANSARGERVGDMMMFRLLELADEFKIETISLSAYADNEPMLKLLARWNFIEQFRETVIFKNDDEN